MIFRFLNEVFLCLTVDSYPIESIDVYCVCMCVYLCMGAHMRELCGGQRYLSQLIFTLFYDYDYRQVFSLNLEFVDLAKLAGQPAPGIFLTIWLLLELQVHAAAPI